MSTFCLKLKSFGNVVINKITITQFDNGIACLIFIKRSHLTLKFKMYLVCGNLSLNKQLNLKKYYQYT